MASENHTQGSGDTGETPTLSEVGSVDVPVTDVDPSALQDTAEVAQSGEPPNHTENPADVSGANAEASAHQDEAEAGKSTLDVVLGCDPPAGHEAYKQVKFENGKWPYAFFMVTSDGGKKTRLQATVDKSGSKEAAERICRLAFVHMTNGGSLEDVKKFRNWAYEAIQASRGELSKHKEKNRTQNPFASGGQVEIKAEVKEAKVEVKVEKKEEKKEEDEDDDKEAIQDVKGDALDAIPKSSNNLIKYDKTGQSYIFKLPEGGPRKSFSSTVARARKQGGDHHDALRIAEECFARKDDLDHDGLVKLREELYQKIAQKEVKAESEGTSVSKIASKREKPPSEKKPNKRQRSDVASDGAATALEEMPEDVPPDHEAHAKVRKGIKHGKEAAFFDYRSPEGVKKTLEITAPGIGSEMASRIARICYFKLHDERIDIAKVMKFKKELLKRLKNHSEEAANKTAPKGSKKRRLSETEALMEKLRTEGRLEGACVIEGRKESKKNASINGTYARVLGRDHAGRPSFEKVGTDKPRYLLFSSRKPRWLISNVADDSNVSGFAFLRVAADSQALPSELPDVRWEVFDGKEEGYRQDPQVKCRALCENSKVPKSARKSVEAQTLELDLTKFMEGARLVQYTKAALDWCDKMGAASLDDVIDNAEELSEALKLKPLERKRLVKAGSSRAHADGDKNDGDKSHDEGNDSSRESSASSSSSSSSGRAPDHWDAASSTMAPSSKIIDLESTPQSVLGSATPIDARRARVCAKMMVRSGLRCSCHFLHLRDCSAHSRTAATESSVQVAGVVVDVLPS
mmetsp:Transcript_18409/g.43109  ORF Transcript_18409/g.43109 Transcript_18409/m.43109 type:complete len:803 (+) Transcript_18409:32-2440(+)